jgi:DNA polymerase-3 subunit gamma/tau
LVNQFLGTIEQDALYQISQSLIDSDEKEALLELGRLISEGKEVFQILSNLISYFRKLMLIKIFNSERALDYIMPESSEKLKEQAYQLSKEEILLSLEILTELEDKLKEAVYPRVLLEIGFLKICNRAKIQILNYQTHLSKEENVEKTKAEEPEELQKEDIPNRKKIVEKENPDSEAEKKNISSNLIEEIKNIWPQILKQLEEKRMYLACCLSRAKAIGLEEGTLRVRVESESNFQFQILEERENKRLVEKLVSEKLGQEIKLRYEKSNPESKFLPRRSSLQEMLRNPKLKKISHMLNAKVLKVIPEDER